MRIFLLFFTLLNCLITQGTIILDPGHGGMFDGTRGNYLLEKNINLIIALKVAELLKQHGFAVVLTRSEDVHLDSDLLEDLKKRAALTQPTDIFVSIHCNSNKNKLKRGYELYVPLHDALSLQSYLLAVHIHHHFAHILDSLYGGTLGNLNLYDLGIRTAKFNVLMHARCPSVLIEMDYLSCPVIEQKLMTPEYQDKLARAITQGIVYYLSYY
jgi:N-acetylmuramoyl-L-alanine amidase